jgi:APA family basic amino acid/polyamine antiporter
MGISRKTGEAPKLERSLGLFETTMYGVGIILGAGIYALLGEGAGIAGNAVWLSFVVAAIVAAFTGLSFCELSSMMPKEAAEYNYAKRAFGRGKAFVVGWVMLLAMIIAPAAVSFGFAGYFAQMFGTEIIPVALAIIIGFSVLNFWGIKASSSFNIVATLIEAGGLVLVIIVGMLFFNPNVDLAFSPTGFYGVMSGAALMFFAFIGFEDITNISEETRDAERIIPKAVILSLVISTILYILVAIAAVSVVGWEALSGSSAPMSMILGNVFGPGAATLMSVIALFSTGNTILICLIVASRMMYGIARDGSLPGVLSKIHPRTRTPGIAVLLTMLVAMGFVMAGNISFVAKLTTASIFIAFLFVNSSLIALRYRAPDEKRHFKVPLNIGKFPVIAGLGFVSAVVMLAYTDLVVLGIEAVLVLVGVAVYIMVRR